MVLKRLLVTTLGALGLGALAAGTASGQGAGEGNIPAPNVFDDQIACSTNANASNAMVPTPSMGTPGMTDLDDLIKASQVEDIDGVPNGIDLASTGYMDLIYVVDPHMPDCGLGPGNKKDAMDNDLVDDASGEPISNDFTRADGNAYVVAKGYSDTLAAFTDLMDKETKQETAQTTLDAAKAAVTTTNPNTVAIAEAQDLLDTADEELMVAETHYNALAGGHPSMNPINRAGVAEWMAKGAVVSAVTKWNKAVEDASDSRAVLDGTLYTDYVDLPDKRVNNVIIDGEVIYTALNAYVSINAAGESMEDNFDDDSQELILPMVASPTNIGEIRKQKEAVDKAVEGLQKALDNNTNALRTNVLTEGLRRAKAEQGHWSEQYNNALADDADKEPDVADNVDTDADESEGTVGEQSIRTRFAAYQAEASKRAGAEADLRAAVANREAATAAVINAFNSAGAFYQQLVDLQQYAKDTASIEVSRLAGLTGDAAPPETQTKAATDAAATAAKALKAATDAQDNYTALQNPDDEGDPRKALVDELLKTGGDDGQALVDAIGATYDETQDNAGRLDALLTPESTMAVLDADGEPMEDADGNPVTTPVPESGRIVDIEESIAGLTGTDGAVMDNAAQIAALTADSDDEGVDEDGPVTANTKLSTVNADDLLILGSHVIANENAILDETTARMDADTALGGRVDAEALAREAADTALDGRIDAEASAREAADIALDGRVDAEALAREAADTALDGRVDAEALAREAADTALDGRVDTEASAREMADTALGGRIDTNVEMIGTNVTNIAANATAIMAEQTARTEADTMLGGRIDTEATARMAMDDELMGHITSNAGNIVSNEMAIGANAGNISTNADGIAANMNSIGSNAASIADNRNMIGELSDDLSVVRAGVAASMALAGMPAINGRGISIGVGSFDGESAFAVGFQIQGEMASFKVGLTSGGGATGASAGVGFQF